MLLWWYSDKKMSGSSQLPSKMATVTKIKIVPTK